MSCVYQYSLESVPEYHLCGRRSEIGSKVRLIGDLQLKSRYRSFPKLKSLDPVFPIDMHTKELSTVELTAKWGNIHGTGPTEIQLLRTMACISASRPPMHIK